MLTPGVAAASAAFSRNEIPLMRLRRVDVIEPFAVRCYVNRVLIIAAEQSLEGANGVSEKKVNGSVRCWVATLHGNASRTNGRAGAARIVG